MEEKVKKEEKPKFVDLLTNAGFKAVFGDEANQDVVMTIINEFLPEHRQVTDIRYLPTEHQGPVLSLNKEFQFDFICSTHFVESQAVNVIDLIKIRLLVAFEGQSGVENDGIVIIRFLYAASDCGRHVL